MNLSIKPVNNGYVIYDDDRYEPGLVRISESTHIATDIDSLCEVIRKIYKTNEDRKSKPKDLVKV